jgi:hypothetical protein
MDEMVEEFVESVIGTSVITTDDEIEQFVDVCDLGEIDNNYYRVNNEYLVVETPDVIEVYDTNECLDAIETTELDTWHVKNYLHDQGFSNMDYDRIWYADELVADIYFQVSMNLEDYTRMILGMDEDQLYKFIKGDLDYRRECASEFGKENC